MDKSLSHSYHCPTPLYPEFACRHFRESGSGSLRETDGNRAERGEPQDADEKEKAYDLPQRYSFGFGRVIHVM